MLFNFLSFVVGVLYIGIGIFVIVYKTFAVKLKYNIAFSLGGLLIVYGILRVVRAIIKYRRR